MERVPNFQVLGNLSAEEKERYMQEMRGFLFEKHLDNIPEKEKAEIEQLECKKTPLETTLIKFANQKTNELMEQAGVAPYDIPERNLHILPEKLFKKVVDDIGYYAVTAQYKQAIFYNAEVSRRSLSSFGVNTFHELLHLKAFNAIAVIKLADGTIDKRPYRAGTYVQRLPKLKTNREENSSFTGLNEAIVSSCERDYFHQMLALPELKDEKAWLDSEEAVKIKKEVAAKRQVQVGEVFWISPDGKEAKVQTYPELRIVFDYMITEIQKELQNQYQSVEAVQAEFLKSHFTGHLVTIAKIVEQTFGKGSFRLLGTMHDFGIKEPSLILSSLQLARAKKQNT